jgi:hypothetical protein
VAHRTGFDAEKTQEVRESTPCWKFGRQFVSRLVENYTANSKFENMHGLLCFFLQYRSNRNANRSCRLQKEHTLNMKCSRYRLSTFPVILTVPCTTHRHIKHASYSGVPNVVIPRPTKIVHKFRAPYLCWSAKDAALHIVVRTYQSVYWQYESKHD